MEVTTIIPRKLYLGNILDGENERLLKDLKITHVVNVSSQKTEVVPVGGKTLHFPLIDGEGNPPEKFNQVIDTVNDLMAATDTVVLVHCRVGVSRSPTIVATWFAKDMSLPFDKAMDIIVKMRPIAEPHYALRRLARKYLKEVD